MIGTPAARIAVRARVFEPISSIAALRRADPGDARVLDGAREGSVLGEEAVAGMDRLGARPLARRRRSARRRGSSRPPGPGRPGTPRRPRARAARRGLPPSRRRPAPIPSSRRVRKIRTAISPRFATRTFEKSGIARVFSRSDDAPGSADRRPRRVRAARRAPLRWDFPNNEYWATAVFCVAMATDWFDGRIARRRGVTSAARLAARPDRRQGARARGARDADRGRRLAGAGWSPRSSRASC